MNFAPYLKYINYEPSICVHILSSHLTREISIPHLNNDALEFSAWDWLADHRKKKRASKTIIKIYLGKERKVKVNGKTPMDVSQN